MNRKLKALGLALFAALALSAVSASTAAAVNTTDHITAPEEWTPTASAINVQEFRPTTLKERPNFKCNKVAATGKAVPATTDNITVTPEYSECEAENEKGEKAKAFVEQEGCDYHFTGKTTKGNPTGGEHATVDIVNHEHPAEPCEIKIKVTEFKFPCAGIPNQEVKDAVRYEQGGTGVGEVKDIVINATAHNILNTTENSPACPTPTGETETHTDGSYVGKVTVKGHNAALVAVPLTLTEKATP